MGIKALVVCVWRLNVEQGPRVIWGRHEPKFKEPRHVTARVDLCATLTDALGRVLDVSCDALSARGMLVVEA